MNDLRYLNEAVLTQLEYLVNLLETQSQNYCTYNRVDEELSKLYEFAVKNNFFIPMNIHVAINNR